MNLPGPVATQLAALLRRDPEADRIALVWSEPLSLGIHRLELHGCPLRVVYCGSQLAIREQLIRHRSDDGERLVMLSPFDQSQLARDILARLWHNRPERISPWRSLQELLGVQDIDPRLARHRWLAEALLRHYDGYADRVRFGQVLDRDNAWRALTLAAFGFDQSPADPQSVLLWSLGVSGVERLRQTEPEIRAHLDIWLEPGCADLAPVLATLLRADGGRDLLALGLVADVLYGHRADSALHFQAQGRFAERFLGSCPTVETGTLARFGQEALAVAEQRLTENDSTARRTVTIRAQLARADELLESLGAASLVEVSEVLPGAYEQRLTRLAEQLQRHLRNHRVGTLEPLLDRLRRHRLAAVFGERTERMRMAVRLARWLRGGRSPAGGDARQTVLRYVAEGGHVDWARSRIWQGDENPAVDETYRSLSQAVKQRREEANERFGRQLHAVAEGANEQPDALYIESLLDRVVAPLAGRHPVLLLVLDGMSLAVYRELAVDLAERGWQALRQDGIGAERCLLAVLPTVTELSRTALLTGRLAGGSQHDEKTGFAAHAGLKQVSSPRYPPLLLHKGQLQAPGGGGLANEVRAQLATGDRRVIGLVINSVDDHLSSGSQVVKHWRIDAIALLHQVLDAAREGNRIVVLCSDHGHVINHDMQYRAVPESTGRFHTGDTPASEGEIALQGHRVLTANNRVVLPWSERIRYASRKFGYHGGGSLQEVVVPLGVFAGPGESLPEGWTTAPAIPPDWWRAPDMEHEGHASTNAAKQGNGAQLALFQDAADDV